MDFNEAVDFEVTADSGERMDLDGALDFLEQRSGRGSVMGLDSIRNLLRELLDPQKDLEFVHIAGTNGKGSVSACLSSILRRRAAVQAPIPRRLLSRCGNGIRWTAPGLRKGNLPYWRTG